MVDKRVFGYTNNKEKVIEYHIVNDKGNYVDILNYGCRIRNICVKNRKMKKTDVCLGFDTISEYESDSTFMGAAVGRYANRIDKGEFRLNGKGYRLTCNEGNNHLHGGINNFGNYIWDVELDEFGIVCTRKFEDKEEGYPGRLNVKIVYQWDNNDRLTIAYTAVSNKDTIVNFTNHTYFNLSGNPENTILSHNLAIYADRITPIYSNYIPTGEIRRVKGTPFDFSYKHEIGKYIAYDDEQLWIGKGYDHNYAFGDSSMKLVAMLEYEENGIRMNCYTTQPGLQLYTGNNLSVTGKNRIWYSKYSGVCLETQNYPDAINRPEFPSPILRRGEKYQTTTIYEFVTS